MNITEGVMIIGMAVGFVMFIKHEVNTLPSTVELVVDIKGRKNPDLVIGVSKILENYSDTVVIRSGIITNKCRFDYGRFSITIDTIHKHKRNIMRDITQYMMNGFSFLDFYVK